MKLYAVCWQDVTEPWGWNPEQFFWERAVAQWALAAVVEHTADRLFHEMQQREDQAVRADEEQRERLKVMGGGLFVRPVGMPDREPEAPEPYQRRSDDELKVAAEEAAMLEWSIQEYEVPPPPRPGQGWVPPPGAYS